MDELPQGTTHPRGFPSPERIRWRLVAARDLFELRYGRALVEAGRRPGNIVVYGTNGPCGKHDDALFKGPGVILGRKGQGPLGVEWSNRDFWVIDTAYSLIPKNDSVDLRYAYYLISLIGLNHLKDGTSNPSLSREVFGAQALPLPPLDTQRQIVSVLESLDDKIELNRRMNDTLEAMGKAIFDDWFVDFGPTRAKAEGREPYLSSEIWGLFPDRFDDEDLPTGWEPRPLDQIARFLNGLALQKYPPDGDEYLPVIKIAELRSGVTKKSGKASSAIPPEYIVLDGDVLFSWSGSLTHLVWTGGTGALNQHLFKVTSESFPKWFYFHWIGHHMPMFQAIAASKATTMGHIQRHHLSEGETIIAQPKVMAAANALIGPLFEKCIANNLENRTLTQIRDLLLPKLMSGEIRLRDAEKMVEEAA